MRLKKTLTWKYYMNVRSARVYQSCAQTELWLKKSWTYLENYSTGLKWRKNIHYTTILWGEIKDRLVKSKLHSLRSLLDSGATASIVLHRYKKIRKKTIKLGHWRTRGVDLNRRYKSNIEILLPELDERKTYHQIFMWMNRQGTISKNGQT